jgi:flagellar biosynthetic protein FliO
MAGSGGAYGELLATSLIVLVVVCVLAYLVVRLARRYLHPPRGASGGLLDVIARVPLEPRRSLYVVEVAGKALLVGTSEMGLTVLSELDRDVVRARAEEPPRTSFVAMVQAAWTRRKSAAPTATAPATDTVAAAVPAAAAAAVPAAAAAAVPAAAAAAVPAAAAAAVPAAVPATATAAAAAAATAAELEVS